MMKEHGFDPEIMPADVDESIPEGMGPRAAVMFLAMKKAHYVRERTDLSDSVIVAADTIVYDQVSGKIMGKPSDREEGFRMLSPLRGRYHIVMTGVAISDTESSYTKLFYEETKVHFKKYSDDELWEYLDTDEPYDKAGAYAVQGAFSKYTDHLEGDRNNVIGFPWDRFADELDTFLKR